MLKIKLSLLFFFMVSFCFSQEITFKKKTIYGGFSINELLENRYDVKLTAQPFFETKSLSATHTHYQLYYQDIEIAFARVKVHQYFTGQVDIYYPNLGFISSIAPHPNQVKKATDFFSKIDLTNAFNVQIKSTYWLENNELIPAYSLEYETAISHEEIIINSNHKILYNNDFSSEAKPDSLIAINIFKPDPITSAKTVYGGVYQDFEDSNVLELNEQLFIDSIYLRWDSLQQVYKLESDYFIATDFGEPFIDPPTSSDSTFLLGRGDIGFEYFNAFYHLNRQSQNIINLGFDALLRQVVFDANGSNLDQSRFLPSFSDPRMFFGVGGVDDAEDADVIIHEYGHAISSFASPFSNVGEEREALDEGSCDFLAYCYSTQFSDYQSDSIFNWDGHNEFWDGRTIPKFRTYPSDLVDDIYLDGLIWTSALKEISDEIGCEKTTQLLVESFFSFYENMKIIDAGPIFLRADSLINSAVNKDIISNILCDKGLIPGCEDTALNTLPLRNPYLGNTQNYYENNATIYVYPNKTELLSYAVFTIKGQLIQETQIAESKRFYSIDLPMENPGIYILRLYTNEGYFSFKLIKGQY